MTKTTTTLVFALVLAGCASGPGPASAPVAAAAPAACKAAPSEVAIQELSPGTGDKALGFRTSAMVHYSGWLYDGCAQDLKGKPFDSSIERKVPFGLTVGAGQVIKGWDEGLVGMKEGGKRRLVIPPNKAYGAREVGKIPPNSTLVFDIEVVKIVHQP